MDTWEKLVAVSRSEMHDEDGAPSFGCQSGVLKEPAPQPAKEFEVFLAQAGSRKVPLLKTMLTTACSNDCNYCVFRKQRDVTRYSFSPDEMAALFMKMVAKRKVEGLFLSSGIPGSPITCQDRLLDTVAIVREKYAYRGYIHLKIMPGADEEQMRQSIKYANRVSINIEAPNAHRLKTLAPMKRFDDVLLSSLQTLSRLIAEWEPDPRIKSSSLTTQIVTGAVGESDLEIMAISQRLYQQFHLARVYYSRFSPAADTPLENMPALDYTRYVRIYQASFLLRDYGFDLEEMPFLADGNLPLAEDPKMMWAKQHYGDAPVEINKLTREELIRLPGIGKIGAERIYNVRKQQKITSLHQLEDAGVGVSRLAPFVLLNGHRVPQQLPLWKTNPSISLESPSR